MSEVTQELQGLPLLLKSSPRPNTASGPVVPALQIPPSTRALPDIRGHLRASLNVVEQLNARDAAAIVAVDSITDVNEMKQLYVQDMQARAQLYTDLHALLNEAMDRCNNEPEIVSSRKRIAAHISSARYAFFPEPTLLSTAQIQSLFELQANQSLSGCLLLVDDTPTMFKILFKYISSCLQIDRSEINMEIDARHWQEQKISSCCVKNWGIIIAANGNIAQEILQKITITAMITDNDMPGLRGVDLIKNIREQEQKQASALPLKIALHTGGGSSAENATTSDYVQNTLNAKYITKGESNKIIDFFCEVMNLAPLEQHHSPAVQRDEHLHLQALGSARTHKS